MGTGNKREENQLMHTLQQSQQNSEETSYETTLLDLIAQWPNWKIQALCLDESDLKLKETILNQRQLHHV